MTRFPSWLTVALLSSLQGCASGATSAPRQGSEAGAPECAVQLGARGPLPGRSARAGRARVATLSQVVVHAEAPLAPLQQTLESRVQKRLAEGQVGIGLGGAVRYTMERGAFTLSTTESALIIETPVQARAEACRGTNCYASCEPQALVRAQVSLMLRPDYGFQPSSVSLRFTRGCKVRALGGFLTIDLTPTLEAELQPELGKVGRAIDRQLPDVRVEAERAWRELWTPRELPLGACLLLQPSGLVQGPLSASSDQLRARFAVLMTPELRVRCQETTAAVPPLPALRSDAALPEEGVIRLGMVTALASLGQALEATRPASLSGQRVRTKTASVTAWHSDVDVELMLGGDVCGSVAFGAQPDFSGEGQHIGLTRPELSAGERERLDDAQLDGVQLVGALTAAASVAPLLSVQGFRTAAPALARALSQPPFDISARVSSARAAGAAARGDELVAWLEARGSVRLSAASLSRKP